MNNHINLSKVDQDSYLMKFKKVTEKTSSIKAKYIKGIIQSQFSLESDEADKILTKVYNMKGLDQSQPIDQEGFFLILKCIQCLQNRLHYNDVDIYSIYLKTKLQVKKKDKLQQQISLSLKSDKEEEEDHLKQSQYLANSIKEQANKLEGNFFFQQNQENIILDKSSNFSLQPTYELPQPSNKITIQQPEIIINNPLLDIVQESTDLIIIGEQYQQKIQYPQFEEKKQEEVQNEVKEEVKKLIEEKNDIQNDAFEILGKEQGQNDISLNNFKSIRVKPFIYIKNGLFTGFYQCQIVTLYKEDQIHQFQVDRRFSDFDMLQEYILNKFKGAILPKLPEKDSLIDNITKFLYIPQEKLELRRAGLEKYLKTLLENESIITDTIFSKFLNDTKKFEDILYELRYDDISFEEEEIVPDPKNYYFTQKVKNLFNQLSDTTLSDIRSSLMSGIFKNVELDAKFRQEFKHTQEYYQLLKKKYEDLEKFEKLINIYFYQKQGSKLVPPQVQSHDDKENNLILAKQIYLSNDKIQQNYYDLKKREQKSLKLLIDDIRRMLDILNNIFYTYENLQVSIYKWHQQRNHLAQQQTSENFEKLKLKNQKEEESLQKSIEGLNKTLKNAQDNLIAQIQKLLFSFTEQITNLMQEIIEL